MRSQNIKLADAEKTNNPVVIQISGDPKILAILFGRRNHGPESLPKARKKENQEWREEMAKYGEE